MALQFESRVYRLRGTTAILGSAPASRDIRTQYIISKAPESEREEEELTNSYDSDEKGVTVFNRDRQDHLCLMSHQIKGFFKEALTALKAQCQVANIGKKVDTLISVGPKYIPIKRGGLPLYEEDEMLERPLRAETMRGPRVALQSSEMINPEWSIEFELTLFPSDGTAKSKALTWDAIETALEYGAFHGLGQWRGADYGHFTFEQIAD